MGCLGIGFGLGGGGPLVLGGPGPDQCIIPSHRADVAGRAGKSKRVFEGGVLSVKCLWIMV